MSITMKKLALIILLLVLSGCAAFKGTVATYTGSSPVVEVAQGIYACNRYQVNHGLLALGPKVAVLNVAEEIDDTPIDGLLMMKVGIRETNDDINRQDLARAVATIGSLRAEGYIVVVHCWFGENRTPWVISHYLADKYGTPWQSEFAGIKAVRPECYFKRWMF